MFFMPAVPVVHEQMHQRAGEQQQERQRAEQVGAVLADEKESGDRKECNQNPVISTWGRIRIVPGMFVMFHHIFTRFSLSAFRITDTELKLIAAAAMMGESSKPKNG